MTRENAPPRNERDVNRLLAEQIGDEFQEPHMERPALVKGDRGALVFAGTLLVAFWGGIALLLRGCSA